jgi:hypothetical protein
MATKSFKGYVSKTPIEFDLESPDGQHKITIHCRSTVPGSRFLDFMSKAGGTEDFAGMSKAVRDIFDATIIAEDVPMFWAFCDDPDNGIDLETLSEIAGWLSEQYAGERPPVPSGA